MMEAPPPRLEKLVLALIPPLAREAVAGDLCETFESPRQYAREALRTVPFVIASEMRRHLNVPALLLKLALAWFFLGGMALWLLPPLILADAWQPVARPEAHRAIRQTMVLGVMAMILVVALSMNIGFMLQTGLRRPEWLALTLFGLVVPALLCGLRTGLILHNDRHAPLPVPDVAQAYHRFRARARLHNIAEGAALVAAAVLALLWLGRAGAMTLTALYLLTAVYLLVRGAPRTLTGDCDLRSLQALYARALLRQKRLRHFLWWLWCAPALMAAASRMHAPLNGSPLVAAANAAGLALVCFVLAAINRENGGRVQEQIGALERLTG